MARKRHQHQPREVKKTPLLDIVIPVWDGFGFLIQCLKAIPAAVENVQTQVIAFDNGSDKATADDFYRQVAGVKIVRSRENLGFAEGCNRGARQGFAPLILFLNSDAIMYPGSIDKMVRRMDDPEVGVCGARLLFPKDSPSGPPGTIQHAGMMVTLRAEVVHAFLGWSNDNPRTRKTDEFFSVTGACFMTRRSLWNKIGGFDPSYVMGSYEEVDYCMKIRHMLGKKIVVEHDAVGEHFVGASVIHHQQNYPLQQNKSLFMSRWLGYLMWDEWRIL